MARKRLSAWEKAASKAWPHYEWIRGDGRYAVWNPCRWLTIELFANEQEAREQFAHYQRVPCGDLCRKNNHRLYDLETMEQLFEEEEEEEESHEHATQS
jgi:hypothetical protein